MTTRLGNTLNVGTQPRDVLQPALTTQIIAYHSTAVHRLVETTELGLAAAGVLNTALGHRQGLEITLTGSIILSDHARLRLPTLLGGASGSVFGGSPALSRDTSATPSPSATPDRPPPLARLLARAAASAADAANADTDNSAAADQLAAYMWLVPDEGMQNDAPQVVEDFAEMFKRYSANRGDLVKDDFADEHSLDLTRMYNLACWVYGANPTANADVVAQVGLPKSRADRCEFEFQRISKAWKTLLAPHVK
jgi:hypothetical protein